MADRHVVMVEPDATLAGKLRKGLEGCGLKVEVLADGTAASLKLQDATPELVLLDVDPSMGDAICKVVKKKSKQTPVILFSPNGETKKGWFGKSPDLVMRKPVVVEDVVREVKQLLKIDSTEEVLHDSDLVEGEVTDVRDFTASKPTSAPPTGTFAKEHEVLELRQQVNTRDKQIIDLREEIGQKDRQVLQLKHASLEVEKKANALNDTILALEKKLLTANERIDTQDREAEALMATIEAKEQEMKATKAKMEADHAAALDRLRKEHEGVLADLKRKHEAAIYKAGDLVRNNAKQVEQAREALANAQALLAKNVGTLTLDDTPPPKKPV